MRILAGGPCRQHPEVLAAHLRCMQAQQTRVGTTVDLCYIDDNGNDTDAAASRELLRSASARTLPAPSGPSAAYRVTEQTHEWSEAAFVRLAHAKQQLIDLAVAEGYDALWLVDTDLLCAPETLQSLIDSERDCVSGVFWTRWMPDTEPLPQVWMEHPYGFRGLGLRPHEALRRLEDAALMRVRGLGACTLLSRRAMERGAAAFLPLLDDLPRGGMWQGEDRHFCVRAERMHLQMWADAWPRIWHCYRPSDRAHIAAVLGDLLAEEPRTPPRTGDWVSVKLTHCEEPQLHAHPMHVRCRLGDGTLADTLDDAARGLTPGGDTFVHLRYGSHEPTPALRGRTRLLHLRLLDVRPEPQQ